LFDGLKVENYVLQITKIYRCIGNKKEPDLIGLNNLKNKG